MPNKRQQLKCPSDPSSSHNGVGANTSLTNDELDIHENLATLRGHEGDVKLAVWHPFLHGYLAACSYDGLVKLWGPSQESSHPLVSGEKFFREFAGFAGSCM